MDTLYKIQPIEYYCLSNILFKDSFENNNKPLVVQYQQPYTNQIRIKFFTKLSSIRNLKQKSAPFQNQFESMKFTQL